MDELDCRKLDMLTASQESYGMDDSIPASVRKLMERRGYTKRRGSGVSLTALAEATGVHTTTISNLFSGLRSRPATVEAVAEALGISSPHLRTLLGEPAPASEVYVGPDASRRLTQRQRAALTELILATVERPHPTDLSVVGGGARAVAEAMGLDEPAESQEDHELAASYGDEGIGPDELPEGGP